jgi:hypothetical protein
MVAIRYVSQVLMKNDDPLESFDECYQGGEPSVIPQEIRLNFRQQSMASRMHRRVPAGYIMRPEMHSCLKDMQTSRFHLQFLLTTSQARELAGERSTMVRCFGVPKEVTICISDEQIPVKDEQVSDNDEIRVCDIGSDDQSRIEIAVVEIVGWMVMVGIGDWSIKMRIPERVAARLRDSHGAGERDEKGGRGFRHTILMPPSGESNTRRAIKLEPAEEESILVIHSLSGGKGIQSAVNTALVATYAVNDNVL